jgi:hypothetical protein
MAQALHRRLAAENPTHRGLRADSQIQVQGRIPRHKRPATSGRWTGTARNPLFPNWPLAHGLKSIPNALFGLAFGKKSDTLITNVVDSLTDAG